MNSAVFSDPAFWLLVIFVIPLIIRVPIAVALGFSALVIVWGWDMGIGMISYNFFAGVAKFPLLAIPFFILAGYIMERAGIAARIIELMEARRTGCGLRRRVHVLGRCQRFRSGHSGGPRPGAHSRHGQSRL